MTELLRNVLTGLRATMFDLAPIAVLFAVFHYGVLKRPLNDIGRILVGAIYVLVGLTLFRTGLAISLIPTGESMARQLAAVGARESTWQAYGPVVAFAAAIGFAATLIEPTLIAVAERLRELSGGTVRPWSLRLIVAAGLSGGLLVGTLRIILGVPLELVVGGAFAVLIVLSIGAPRAVVSIALDSGAIATSVVTVPLIAAYGIALAETVPGRSVLLDGFGLIVMALIGPPVALLLFAQGYRLYQNWLRRGENRAV